MDAIEPRDFTYVSMSDLRARAGEIVDSVAESGKAFIVERKGQPLACLVPVQDYLPAIPQARLNQEQEGLRRMASESNLAVNDKREIVVSVPMTVGDAAFTVEVVLPHGYPNAPPVVRASPVEDKAPHRFPDGSLCIYGMMSRWNPGEHDVHHSIHMAGQWLESYRSWLGTGIWTTRYT